MKGIFTNTAFAELDEIWSLTQFTAYCLFFNRGRGIWKAIDQNREFLQCLQKHAPDLLESRPLLEKRLAAIDAFLVALREKLDLPDSPGFSGYPRPWPKAKSMIENGKCRGCLYFSTSFGCPNVGLDEYRE